MPSSPLSKTKIDQLGNRLKNAELAETDLRLLDQYRRSFGDAYEEVILVIRDHLDLRPTGRPAKSTSAIVEKLRRESIRLSQIQDIAGCRVVVPDGFMQERAVQRLKHAFLDSSVIDRRQNPSHGYRAVHVVVKTREKLVEIQVRTQLQHLWAEFSEKLSDTRDPTIKYGGGDPGDRKDLDALSDLIGISELPKEWGEQQQLMEKLKRTIFEILEHLLKKGG